MDSLGSPPRFTIERIVRPTFKVRWEYDGVRQHYDPGDGSGPALTPERREKVRSFYSEPAAYAWLARRMIFHRRDGYRLDTSVHDTKDERSCGLCATRPFGRYGWDYGGEIGPKQCRYHADQPFRRLASRLARWLRWRDRREHELAVALHVPLTVQRRSSVALICSNAAAIARNARELARLCASEED